MNLRKARVRINQCDGHGVKATVQLRIVIAVFLKVSEKRNTFVAQAEQMPSTALINDY
jgi:hypothetical protein